MKQEKIKKITEFTKIGLSNSEMIHIHGGTESDNGVKVNLSSCKKSYANCTRTCMADVE
jgi:hypothetical protein